MRKTTLAIAFAAVLVPAVSIAQGPPSCSKLLVSSANENRGRAATLFSATKTVDLTLTALFQPKLSGDHLLELRLFTPDGNLYRSMTVPITSTARTPGGRSVAGHPRPVVEKVLSKYRDATGNFLQASVPFPVAGTDIVSSSLYGQWRIDAYLDNAPAPCVRAATFTINP